MHNRKPELFMQQYWKMNKAAAPKNTDQCPFYAYLILYWWVGGDDDFNLKQSNICKTVVQNWYTFFMFLCAKLS